MIGPMPRCIICKHLHKSAGDIDNPGMRCDAFPTGIPMAIISKIVEHKEPYFDDKGIRYEPVSDQAEANYQRDYES